MNMVINRRYTLRINGHRSTRQSIAKTEVSQASHCGPLLFLIYCNEVSTIYKTSRFQQYADNLKLYSVVYNHQDSFTLQKDINQLTEWARINNLSINSTKPKFIQFGRRNDYCYFVGIKPIEEVDIIKHLSIIIDPKLKFTAHVQYI